MCKRLLPDVPNFPVALQRDDSTCYDCLTAKLPKPDIFHWQMRTGKAMCGIKINLEKHLISFDIETVTCMKCVAGIERWRDKGIARWKKKRWLRQRHARTARGRFGVQA